MGENQKQTRMSELKDPAIKLFGKTISLPPPLNVDVSNSSIKTPSHDNKNVSGGEEESVEAVTTSSVVSEDHRTIGTDSSQDMKKDEPSESSDHSQEKTLKKPDKILPCPRCNSMDTKFCYYNNYNVNQPRHFCKNCQRYWTAGGIMRNVPVGSGRRKNKTSSSATNYRNINGTVLAFGSDRPLCESLNSVLDLVENAPSRPQNCVPNEQLNAPSSTSLASIERGNESMWKNFHGFPPPQVPFFSFPVPFYPPAPYWSLSPWNMPWISPSSSSDQSTKSQVLGKHSRDGHILKSEEAGRGVLIPKALRIDDDSNEAAKSSIWSTLGIKNDSPGASLLKAFSSKADEKNRVADHSWLMQANPAALSRSLNFHEST